MIQVNNIDVAYGPIEALHHVSIEVGENEIISIIGANGAGKSTLMKAIMGICKPSKGEILFCGAHIERAPTHLIVRKGVVLVPEGRKIFPAMSVLENLEMGAYSRSGGIQAQLDDAFGFFPRLYERKHQKSGTLSGGEQQMLAIARGLMSSPRVLLLDEPSMGLAPIIVDEVFETIQRINREKGMPILLVEQNAYIALNVSSRCYVLENGLIRLEGQSSELLQSPEVKLAYLGG